MDEPTAVLAPQEIDDLFNTLRSMAAEGKSIIFISHKLGEITDIADRVTVLRRGRVTATGLETKKITRRELARQMVGRDVVFRIEKETREPGDVVLSVESVHAHNDKGLTALEGISLQVREGEILGLAGVAGNGQRELAQVITGMRVSTQGRVLLKGEQVNNRSARFSIQRGLAYVPEDRTHVGSAPNLSMTDNVIMKSYRRAPIARGWTIHTPTAVEYAEGLKAAYEIAVPTIETPVRLLSGGNLQRVILAREISGEPSLMVAVQPTRGLDVGAIEGVHRLLLEQRKNGTAILLISEELEELLSLSDRIAVIYEGQIMGEISEAQQAELGSEEELLDTIGLMMTGTPLEIIQAKESVNYEHE
jgi:simple sugar transport system ATP-binding protein